MTNRSVLQQTNYNGSAGTASSSSATLHLRMALTDYYGSAGTARFGVPTGFGVPVRARCRSGLFISPDRTEWIPSKYAAWQSARRDPWREMVGRAIATFGPKVSDPPVCIPVNIDDIPSQGTIGFNCPQDQLATCLMLPSWVLWSDFYRLWPEAPKPASSSAAELLVREIVRRARETPWLTDKFYLAGICHKTKIPVFEYARRNASLVAADIYLGPPHRWADCTDSRTRTRFAPLTSPNKVEWWRHLRFKFALYVPGNGGAPRLELLYLLASGRVVVMLTPTTNQRVEFYFPMLVPGVHYITVESLDELPTVQQRFRDDPASYERIAFVAQNSAIHLSNTTFVLRYTSKVISAALRSSGKASSNF